MGMRTIDKLKVFGLLGASAVAFSACGSDAGDDGATDMGGNSATGGKSSSDGSGGKTSSTGGKPGKPDNTGGKPGKPNNTGGMGGEEPQGTGGEEPTGTGGTEPGPSYPTLPSVLSLNGCEETGPGPLCSVEQDDDDFTANCGGTIFTGTIDEEGAFSFENEDAATSCSGELRLGRLRATTCVSMVTGETSTEEVSCDLNSDPLVLPGFECLELPSTLTDVVVCSEGADQDGETINAGNCSVIQDGCSFQAVCEDGVVLSGSVSETGVSFNQELVALADAEVAEPAEGEEPEAPAFVKGDVVSHSCSATIEGTSLAGECGAGRLGRRGTNTSVCAVSGTGDAVAACEPLAPSLDHLFVLDSCELLKDGEGATPGIGEPVCSYRQNNCVWQLQCGREIKFEGKLAPTDSKATFSLAAGTPCEVAFDATGKMTGKCTVAGEAACNLKSKTAQPDASCDVFPEEEALWARGCGDGGGSRLECTSFLQHGCNFMGACAFAGPLTVAGEVLAAADTDSGRNRLEFSGIGDWACHAEQATADDIENDARVEGEWFGDCESPEGGLCRNNYDAVESPGGFRGLQLFWADELPAEEAE